MKEAGATEAGIEYWAPAETDCQADGSVDPSVQLWHDSQRFAHMENRVGPEDRTDGPKEQSGVRA